MLDRDYSPSSLVPDTSAILDAYEQLSRQARTSLPGPRDIAYGPSPSERLDLFVARRPDAPLLVYVHGGYWQELSKDVSAFPALDLVPAGVAVATLGYGLAPAHHLDAVTAMVRRGILWLADNVAGLGLAPRQVHLAGSSAGAHLVAEAVTGSTPQHARARRVVSGVVLLSGIYELAPLVHTYVNDALGLDAAAARRHSPLRRRPSGLPPAVIARGEHETHAFQREHRAAVTWWGRRAPVTDLVVAGRNHFDLPFDLGSASTALGRAVLHQLELTAGATSPQRPGPPGPNG